MDEGALASEMLERRVGWSESQLAEASRIRAAVRDYLLERPSLLARSPMVLLHGSAARGTALPEDSDIDLCVVFRSIRPRRRRPMHAKLSFDDESEVEVHSAFPAARDELHRAMAHLFARRGVLLDNRVIKVLPCAGEPLIEIAPTYLRRMTFQGRELLGVESRPMMGRTTVTFPLEHAAAVAAKDARTRGRFLEMVRMFKSLRNDCLWGGRRASHRHRKDLPSIFIESAIWNVPDFRFRHPSFLSSARLCSRYIVEGMVSGSAKNWTDPSSRSSMWLEQRWEPEFAVRLLAELDAIIHDRPVGEVAGLDPLWPSAALYGE